MPSWAPTTTTEPSSTLLSAHLHVGRYVHGLAEAAQRAGVQIHERNAATALHRLPEGGFFVETLHGTIRATQGMAATDADTDKAMPWFRKRLIYVGNFVIVTEPLGDEPARQLIPNNAWSCPPRTSATTFAPDNRLAFGGRARFAPQTLPRTSRAVTSCSGR